MSGVAHSHTEVVSGMGRALRAYGTGSATAADQAGAVTRSTLTFVEGEVRDRIARLAAAEDALQACLADPLARCAGEQQRVVEAERRLAAARQARGIAEQTVHRVAAARSRFVTEVTSRVSEGTLITGRKGSDLEAYLRAGGGGGVAGGPAPSTGAPPATSGGLPPGVRAAAGLPPGYGLVPLSMIDDGTDAVTGRADFDGDYSPEDMVWAFGAFDDVVLAAVGGLPEFRTYLRGRDSGEGHSGTRSYDRTYSGFLTDSYAIKLNLQADGRFEVANGRHRIWVARELGRDWVPARVRG